jgi:hypothetical protein
VQFRESIRTLEFDGLLHITGDSGSGREHMGLGPDVTYATLCVDLV